MIDRFPPRILDLLRCDDDAGELEPYGPAGGARCVACGREYEAPGGILRMEVGDLHAESDREREIRDREAAAQGVRSADTIWDQMEMGSMLEALNLRPEYTVLELGAGAGRFTQVVALQCARVVAIDISAVALEVASRAIPDGTTVGLVQADATRAPVAEGAFDRVIGTLTSNLPDRRSREGSYAVVARALAPNGLFVSSTHYLGLRARLDGEAKDGRYHADGIYRCLLTPDEIREEMDPYFEKVKVRPIQVVLPLTTRMGLPLVALDRFARRIPGLRGFGTLLQVEASVPRV